MTASELVAKVVANNEEYHRLQVEWEDLKTQLGQLLAAELKTWPGLKALLSVTHVGPPEIFIYTYQGVEILEGGGWGKADPEDDHGYGTPLIWGPMEWSKFEEKVAELGERMGIVPSYATLKRRTEGGTQTLPALRVLYPDKTITLLEKGEVWYVGWDIPDTWYTVKMVGGDGVEEVWAYWSEDAHGGGLTESAQQGTPDWARFEARKAMNGTV